MRQTSEVIEGVLREAPFRRDSKQYPVSVKAVRTLFEGGGRAYDFTLLDYPAVSVGSYCLEVEIDGEKHGKDLRFVPDYGVTEVRWSEPSLESAY